MRLVFLLFIFVSFSCNNGEVLLPKPRIYPKVDYPIKRIVDFESDKCPFTMRLPDYFRYADDVNKNSNEENFDCWFNLHCDDLNSYIYFSYVPFEGRSEFDELVQDAFEMADKHNVKASYRDEYLLKYPEKDVYGLSFEIDGPVASPFQFYLTDSTQHFVRASLYFNDVVNRDSIDPIYQYIKSDMIPLIESFEWKN